MSNNLLVRGRPRSDRRPERRDHLSLLIPVQREGGA